MRRAANAMPMDRRLSDPEVSRVLARASEMSVSQGLSVAQVHDIAREVGLPSDAVQRALDEVASGALTPATVETQVGLPLGLAKDVLLPAPLSDEAWDVLVSMMRATFAAPGKLSQTGAVREWRNGSLRIALEPAPGGQRLRMSTRKGTALQLPAIGGMSTGLAAFSVALNASTRPAAMALAAAMAAISAACIASPYITLPNWARSRSAQFDRLAQSAIELAKASATAAIGDGRARD